jgi:hypothetical protein
VTHGTSRTGFHTNWEPGVARSAIARWRDEGYLNSDTDDPAARSLEPYEVAVALLDLVASPVRIDHVDLLPRVRASQWVDS